MLLQYKVFDSYGLYDVVNVVQYIGPTSHVRGGILIDTF